MTSGSTLALTFDDGPHPDSTPELLAALTATGQRATFFLCGAQAERHPELVRALDRAGMALGNHSWSHPRLTELPAAAARAEIHRTNQVITDLTGRPPTLFRPPYGDTSPAVRALAAEAGLTEVLWDVDTRDWDGVAPDVVLAATITAGPGDTVLLHDHGNRNTVAALPGALAALAARGLRSAPVAAPAPLPRTPVAGHPPSTTSGHRHTSDPGSSRPPLPTWDGDARPGFRT